MCVCVCACMCVSVSVCIYEWREKTFIEKFQSLYAKVFIFLIWFISKLITAVQIFSDQSIKIRHVHTAIMHG